VARAHQANSRRDWPPESESSRAKSCRFCSQAARNRHVSSGFQHNNPARAAILVQCGSSGVLGPSAQRGQRAGPRAHRRHGAGAEQPAVALVLEGSRRALTAHGCAPGRRFASCGVTSPPSSDPESGSSLCCITCCMVARQDLASSARSRAQHAPARHGSLGADALRAARCARVHHAGRDRGERASQRSARVPEIASDLCDLRVRPASSTTSTGPVPGFTGV
jgi:hypothetical protein